MVMDPTSLLVARQIVADDVRRRVHDTRQDDRPGRLVRLASWIRTPRSVRRKAIGVRTRSTACPVVEPSTG